MSLTLTRTRRIVSDDCTAAASIQSTKLLLAFDKPVVLRGIPTGITVNSLPPTAAQQLSSTSVLLTYAAPVTTGQTWTIGNQEPNVRTKTGGFVAAATGTFPN